MTPALSIVIPTQGRQTLTQALESIRSQAGPDVVEIIVVGDTFNPDWDAIAWAQKEAHRHSAKWMTHNQGFHHWGHPQCQAGMWWACGERLAFLGDDDFYLPDGIEAACTTESDCTLFRINNHKRKATIWLERGRLQCGDISAQNIVVVNDKARLGAWGFGPAREGDWAFIQSTVAIHGGPDEVTWRERVIVECL